MTRSCGGWRLAAVLAAAAIGPAGAAAQTRAGDATFSAEVTVTRTLVDRTGRVTQQLPGARYRLERLDGGRMRTTMLPTTTGARRGPLADRYAGVRVEIDPAAGTMRVIDAGGVERSAPAPAAIGAPTTPADDGLIVRPQEREHRTQRLRERFGRPQGSVRSLHRYVSRQGHTTEEVLVAPDTGVAVEINRAENGVLTEHHTFDYTRLADGRLLRSRTRTETGLPDGRGGRMVSLTTLRDITTAGGGR